MKSPVTAISRQLMDADTKVDFEIAHNLACFETLNHFKLDANRSNDWAHFVVQRKAKDEPCPSQMLIILSAHSKA